MEFRQPQARQMPLGQRGERSQHEQLRERPVFEAERNLQEYFRPTESLRDERFHPRVLEVIMDEIRLVNAEQGRTGFRRLLESDVEILLNRLAKKNLANVSLQERFHRIQSTIKRYVEDLPERRNQERALMSVDTTFSPGLKPEQYNYLKRRVDIAVRVLNGRDNISVPDSEIQDLIREIFDTVGGKYPLYPEVIWQDTIKKIINNWSYQKRQVAE